MYHFVAGHYHTLGLPSYPFSSFFLTRPLSFPAPDCRSKIPQSQVRSKRVGTSSRDGTSSQSTPLDIQSILQLPEDAVWGLRHKLHSLFLTLQKYTLNPYSTGDVSPATPAIPADHSAPRRLFFSPLLRLPIEVKHLIYSHLLPPTCEPPVRAPHPRQLQTHFLLTQPILTIPLSLNHRIQSEAIPLLYGSSPQIIHMKVDSNLWAHKTQRVSEEISFSLQKITSAIRHVNLSIRLAGEKRNSQPGEVEAEARVSEVQKGLVEVRKWLSGAGLQTLEISWQEPPQTYRWEQKKTYWMV
ncbi:uncharacterized protein RSE6_02326 [Rhynchosporium secalis]|uniref:Uncharacterized protein n=1 Tax=Rhynchosporium secalis TaxID=38038 RepID=A0A1E1LZY1_RHYSE|nr:uncharacterized protein RSE6_02326 [Rhynchosporium secalis]